MPDHDLDSLERELMLAAVMRMLAHANRVSAHDARAPLNTIQLSIELLAGLLSDELPQLAPRWQKHVSVIRDEIGRLNRVLDSALEYKDPSEPCEESVDVRALLSEIVRALSYEARRRQVDLRQEPGAGSLEVMAPKLALKAALFHLIHRTLQASGKGEQLLLGAMAERGTIRVQILSRSTPVPGEATDDVLARITARVLEALGATFEHGATGSVIRLPTGVRLQAG